MASLRTARVHARARTAVGASAKQEVRAGAETADAPPLTMAAMAPLMEGALPAYRERNTHMCQVVSRDGEAVYQHGWRARCVLAGWRP